jgi:hypothetical protein
MNWKEQIGYGKLDNVFTGFLIAVACMVVAYYFQIRFYALQSLWSYNQSFIVPIVKMSILAVLPACLIFNHFDKLYAFRGALIALVIAGIYFVVKYVI